MPNWTAAVCHSADGCSNNGTVPSFTLLFSPREAVLSRTLDEIQIRVLVNEHRRFVNVRQIEFLSVQWP